MFPILHGKTILLHEMVGGEGGGGGGVRLAPPCPKFSKALWWAMMWILLKK